MEQDEATPTEKKPYIKPEVKEVQILTEETVLGSCMTAYASGMCGSGITTCNAVPVI